MDDGNGKASRSDSDEVPADDGRLKRRNVLLAGAAALVGGAALGKVESADASDGEPLGIGQPNDATSPTSLTKSGASDAAFLVGTGPSILVSGGGVPGLGVAGVGPAFGTFGSTLAPSELGFTSTLSSRTSQFVSGTHAGAAGLGAGGFGVLGSTLQPFVSALTVTAVGVGGFGPYGVWGGSATSPPAPPTGGEAQNPTLGPAGVAATARNGATALTAENPDGFAAKLRGKVGFSTAGSATIPKKGKSITISDPAVTPSSLISVTLLSSPHPNGELKGNGNPAVQWVNPGAGSFTVFLTGDVKSDTKLGYFVFEAISD